MWRWRRGFAAALGAAAVAVPIQAAEAVPPLGGAGKTVTLVTGDRVHVLGNRAVRVEPGEGRGNLAFYRQSRGVDLLVVPSDAAPLIAAGKLDSALFNVTRLVGDGYDDAAREDIPLIVAGPPGRRAAMPEGGTTGRPLASLNGAAVTTRKDRAALWWSSLTGAGSEAPRVWLDGKVRATLDSSVPQIGAPEVWKAGYTGKGVKVGVLDSGIDTGHPDLAGAVVAAKDFTGGGDVQDRNGHGTHVASIITGDGVADPRYRGVAPDAGLVVGKVLDEQANGRFSDVIAGMEWIAGQDVRVVNMSLGSWIPSDGTDPMSAAVDTLTARTGMLFVVGAGNDGADGSVSVPGLATSALTVGAVDRDGKVAEFSSRGPRAGDGVIKPDVTAPGVDITAARAGGGYTTMSGTSMATPHVAGAAALLVQRHPDWKPAQVKSGLMTTARPNGSATVFEQGAGLIDVSRAVAQKITVGQGSVSFDFRTARQVTFHNDGDAPVSLDLGLRVTGPDGEPAPAGMFTVAPAELDVPAGGTAIANLTADPGMGAEGRYSGALTAESGETLRLPVGGVKQPPSHELRLTGIDRTGVPAGGSMETLPWASLVDLGTGEPVDTYVSGNGLAAHVPSGRYALNAVVPSGEREYTLFSCPELTIDGDTTVTADTRRAGRVAAHVDSPTAVRSGIDEIGVVETIAGTNYSFGVGVMGTTGLSAVPTATVTDRPYAFHHVAMLAEPNGPRAYHLQFLTEDGIPRLLDRTVRDASLAAVRSFFHADKPMTGVRNTIALVPGVPFGSGQGQHTVKLPGERTELYTPGVKWYRDLSAGVDGQGFVSTGGAAPAAEPGRTSYRWNAATAGTVVTGIRKSKHGRMTFVASPFTSADARDQRSGPMTQKTSVLRDGEPLGSADAQVVQVTTPPGRARYTVRSTAERPASWTDLGTRSETEWTFPYAPTLEALEEAPLFAVRVQGRFDLRNSAPARAAFTLDMSLTDSRNHTPGTPPRFSAATLEASYDGGASWHPATVTAVGDNLWRAALLHPARPGGQVSLRVHLSDGAETTVAQTVLNAYALR
ncbi:S8 family peptidase [Actinomadura coerulea]|uniref:S8 family peptidase n=1 Tax=Actinomadura coerulea TaxID=46159 RepID=UPI00343F36CB